MISLPTHLASSAESPVVRERAGVSWPLWMALMFAVGLFIAVRVYVNHVESGWDRPTRALPLIVTTSPMEPVAAGSLMLTWSEVPRVDAYSLRIQTVTGHVVVDGLRMLETQWTPPAEALSGLVHGEYRWTVEALDPQGKPIAQSDPASFWIR